MCLTQHGIQKGKLYQEHLPHPALQGIIQCYWTLVGPVPEHKRVIRILPDGCIDIIFDIKGGLSPAHLRVIDAVPSTFLCGAMTSHMLIQCPSNPIVVGIRFHPGGAWLLPSKAVDFTDIQISIKDILPHLASIPEVLAEIAPIPELLVQNLEVQLFKRLQRMPQNHMLIKIAMHFLRPSAPITPVANLAQSLGVNQKTLERAFKQFVGMTPKKFTRINRFMHAVQLLSVKKQSLAHIALEAGYTDQAHFSNDFKTFFVITPSQFFTSPDTVDFLQDKKTLEK